ncbi:hypothetical protein MTO96_029146 [Rhipicephalus appendiculatus]
MDCSLEDPDDNCANDPDSNCANDPDNDCANDPDDNCANDDASGSDAPNDFNEYFAKLSEETLPHQRTTKAQLLLLVLAYIVTAGLTWAHVRGLLILLNTLFGSVKYLYCGHLAADRSHGRVMEAMRKAQGQEAAVEGFKGSSPLVRLRSLDLVWGLPPDYMHCVLEGVARQLVELWLSVTDSAFYLGRRIRLIDVRLRALMSPITFFSNRETTVRACILESH